MFDFQIRTFHNQNEKLQKEIEELTIRFTDWEFTVIVNIHKL